MKISLVAMRAPARLAPPVAQARPPALPTEFVPLPDTPCRPACVSALAWEMLALHIEDAQRSSAICSYAPMRVVVRAVVRELREGSYSWDAIYGILAGAVSPTVTRPLEWATECEMHASRGAALVAHLHSWADVERLSELGEDGSAEAEGAGGR